MFFMSHKEISDVPWNTIASHLLKPVKTASQETMIESQSTEIFFVLTTGCRWAYMPNNTAQNLLQSRFQKLQERYLENNSIQNNQICTQTRKD